MLHLVELCYYLSTVWFCFGLKSFHNFVLSNELVNDALLEWKIKDECVKLPPFRKGAFSSKSKILSGKTGEILQPSK